MGEPRYQVIVIGGGMSGLCAADALLALLGEPPADTGRVLVLERAARLGGRIRTARHPDTGTPLEEGASYFGRRQPHMRRLIERFHGAGALQNRQLVHEHDMPDGSMSLNHIQLDRGPGFDIAFPSEETFSPSVAARRVVRLMEDVTRRIADTALDAPWERRGVRPEDAAWLDALDAITLATWIDRELTAPRLGYFAKVAREMLVMFARTILSSEPEQMSALFFFWYLARCGGARDLTHGVKDGPDSLRFAEGYTSLVEGVAAAVRARGGKVCLDVAVTRLERRDDLWIVPGIAAAERVIMAVPPQAIAGHITFDPPLPPRYGALHAAMRAGQGRTLKGYLCYDTAWWERYAIEGSGGAAELLRHELVRFFGGSLLAVPSDYRREFPGGHSGYSNGTSEPIVWTMPATWHTGPAQRAPALLWFIVGDAYERYKRLPEQAQVAEAHAIIARIFGRSGTPPEPTHATVHDWHAAGGYGGPSAVLAPGQLSALGAALRTPHDGLFFATTEAARTWGGYMEGAIESGVRAAYECAQRPPYDVPRPTLGGKPSVPAWWQAPPALGAPPTRRAGFAVEKLTLIDGKPMAGASALGRHGRVGAEALEARALYLEADGVAVVFCVLDLMSASLALTWRVAAALARTGFPPGLGVHNIILSGTHTHFGPARFYGNSFYDAFAHQAIDLNPLEGLEYGGFDWVGFDEEQAGWLVDDICRAIRGAYVDARPAKVGVGQATAWNAAANRSLAAFERNPAADLAAWRAVVSQLTMPDTGSLEREHAAVDPRVRVIAAFDPESGALIGALATAACHGTARGPRQEEFSPDWFGVAREHVATLRGHDRLAFGASAVGDASPLAPRDIRRGDARERAQGPHLARLVGEKFGRAVVEAIEGAHAAADPAWTLTVRASAWVPRVEWGVGLAIVAGAEDMRNTTWRWFNAYEGNVARSSDPDHDPKWGLPLTRLFLRDLIDCRPSDYHPLYLVQIGGHALWTAPGEPTLMVSERVSRAVCQALGATSASPLSLAGDYAGYFTTEAEYRAQHYEGTHTLYGWGTHAALEAELVALARSAPCRVTFAEPRAPVGPDELARRVRMGLAGLAAHVALRPGLHLEMLRMALPGAKRAAARAYGTLARSVRLALTSARLALRGRR